MPKYLKRIRKFFPHTVLNIRTLVFFLSAFQFPTQLHAVDSKPLDLVIIETDPIEPVEIRHNVEEIIINGRLDQHYNYYVYQFEKYGAFVHARTYLHSNNTVSIYGPFSDRGGLKKTEAPKLYNEVLDYLKRRFKAIDALGTEGYVTIWKQSGFE